MIYNVVIRQTQIIQYRVRASTAPEAETIALDIAEHESGGEWAAETTSTLASNQTKAADND